MAREREHELVIAPLSDGGDNVEQGSEKLDLEMDRVFTFLGEDETHKNSTANPHSTTAAQVGAYTTTETDTAISTAIANLVDTAPGTLDTLNELAAALGDDPNLATTLTTSIATKASIAQLQDYSFTPKVLDIITKGPWIDPEAFRDETHVTDFSVLQAGFNAAIAQEKPLLIARVYNIETNTIVINKGSDVRKPLFIGGGGKILKDEDGFMFSGAAAAQSDMFFHNVHFEGAAGKVVDVFDCGDGDLIRINTSHCYFKNIRDIFYSATYVQDIRMSKDTVIGHTGGIFNIQGGFVVSMDTLRVENFSGQIVKHGGTGVFSSIYNLSVENSVIENSTALEPLFTLKNATPIMKNNYFEVIPQGVVEFSSDAYCGGVFECNTLLGETNDVPFIKWGANVSYASVKGNITPLTATNDTTNIVSGRVIVDNNTSDFLDVNPNNKIYNVAKNQIATNTAKVLNNYHGVAISKSVPDTNKVNLLTFELFATSGGYVTVRGGGIQGNVGEFGINKTFKITRYNSTLIVTLATDESWGTSNLQKDNVFLETSGTSFILKANGRTGIVASQYELFVEVVGKINSLTVN
jgi:hypothetical protein